MKRMLILGAVLILLGLWFGPLPDLAKHSFAAHMALHMAVVAIVAPLLAFALAGGPFDPVRWKPGWFPPIPLSVVELLVVWAWHAPVLHHAARHGPGGFVAEQASFFIAGMLVWLSAVGGDPVRRTARAGAGVTALLLTSMHMTLLGALLALSPRALYSHAEHLPATMKVAQASPPAFSMNAGETSALLGAPNRNVARSTLTPLEDQHLGGAIMLVIGGVSYLAGGLWLTAGLVHRRRARQEVRV